MFWNYGIEEGGEGKELGLNTFLHRRLLVPGLGEVFVSSSRKNHRLTLFVMKGKSPERFLKGSSLISME